MDSKSIGLCPQGFESPRCRFWRSLFLVLSLSLSLCFSFPSSLWETPLAVVKTTSLVNATNVETHHTTNERFRFPIRPAHVFLFISKLQTDFPINQCYEATIDFIAVQTQCKSESLEPHIVKQDSSERSELYKLDNCIN